MQFDVEYFAPRKTESTDRTQRQILAEAQQYKQDATKCLTQIMSMNCASLFGTVLSNSVINGRRTNNQ